MKTMVLAAGLGTRLRPLTNDRPKALIEVGGRTLLEITLTRLRSYGVSEVIVNAHHLADMIVDYLQAKNNFGMRIEVSREDVLLDTGGGLKKAAWFFLEGSSLRDEPFILYNVDVLSNIDLRRMLQFHSDNRALATLAVQERKTARDLFFDVQLQLCPRNDSGSGKSEAPTLRQPLSFCGIHVISPRLFDLMKEDRIFSIITTYLELARRQEKILAFRADEYYWRDVGKLESLSQAEQEVSLFSD